jgi:hypothetical protein
LRGAEVDLVAVFRAAALVAVFRVAAFRGAAFRVAAVAAFRLGVFRAAVFRAAALRAAFRLAGRAVFLRAVRTGRRLPRAAVRLALVRPAVRVAAFFRPRALFPDFRPAAFRFAIITVSRPAGLP